MSVLNGYGKYKRYVKKDTGYQLCSHWTSSNTVHFDDGKTAQTKVGAINGITDSLTSTSSNVALSSKAGKSLQDQVTQLNTGMVPINNRSIVFLGLSVEGITSYPQTVGIYRVINVKVSGLPSDANAYGTLIIMGIGYYMHLYIDHTNHAWIAQTEGEGLKPTAWRKITT